MALNPMDTNKPLGLNLGREQAAMLLKGLDTLPQQDRQNVLYKRLKQDLNMILTIWDRRIKNEKLIQEHRRKVKANKKKIRKSSYEPKQDTPGQRPQEAD